MVMRLRMLVLLTSLLFWMGRSHQDTIGEEESVKKPVQVEEESPENFPEKLTVEAKEENGAVESGEEKWNKAVESGEEKWNEAVESGEEKRNEAAESAPSDDSPSEGLSTSPVMKYDAEDLLLLLGGECPWPSKQVQYELLMYKQCPVEEDDRSRDPTFDLPGAFKFRCGRLVRFDESGECDGKASLGYERSLNMELKRLFYSPYCHFSAQLMPYYNAYALAYPYILFLAFNASDSVNNRVNSRFGISGTPTVILWVEGMGVARMDESLPGSVALTSMLSTWTDVPPPSTPLLPIDDPNIEMYSGANETDYTLYGALFLASFSIVYHVASYTSWGRSQLERIWPNAQ